MATPRLPVGVAWVEELGAVQGRCAADSDMVSDAHRPGVGGGFLEAAAVPNGRSHFPLNVTVFSVTILPGPWYCQTSNTAEPMSPFLSKSTGLNAPS